MPLFNHDPKQKMLELLDQGLMYEDDFIKTYGELLINENLSDFFHDNQEKAKQALNHLIKDSESHRAALLAIKQKFQ